ncbi:hypothetical protein SOVF_092380 [Spinacia oleracea]|nr:hypothetical protein SOVF_092380 [Spinacia oleracea]
MPPISKARLIKSSRVKLTALAISYIPRPSHMATYTTMT